MIWRRIPIKQSEFCAIVCSFYKMLDINDKRYIDVYNKWLLVVVSAKLNVFLAWIVSLLEA